MKVYNLMVWKDGFSYLFRRNISINCWIYFKVSVIILYFPNASYLGVDGRSGRYQTISFSEKTPLPVTKTWFLCMEIVSGIQNKHHILWLCSCGYLNLQQLGWIGKVKVFFITNIFIKKYQKFVTVSYRFTNFKWRKM